MSIPAFLRSLLGRTRRTARVAPRRVVVPRPPLPRIQVKDARGAPRWLQFQACLVPSFAQLVGGDVEGPRTLEVLPAHPGLQGDDLVGYLEVRLPSRTDPQRQGSRFRFKPVYTGRLLVRRLEHLYTAHPAIARGWVVASLAEVGLGPGEAQRVEYHRDRIVRGFNEEEREDFFPDILG